MARDAHDADDPGAGKRTGREASAEDVHTLSVQVANQLINIANKRLEDGLPPEAVAAGLRHAAANFSAFAVAHGPGETPPGEAFADEFRQMFEYYLDRHRPQDAAGHGLGALIDEAKDGW